MLRLDGMDSTDSTSSLQASSPQVDHSDNPTMTPQPNQVLQPVVPTQAVVTQVPEPAQAVTAPQTPIQAVGQVVQSGVLPQANQFQGQPVSGGLQKELLLSQKAPETVPIVEVGKDRELEPEVEGWIEHLKQDDEIKLPEPIKDQQGNILMAEAPAQVVQDKLVVPMTQQGVQAGLKQSVNDSARWLSVWIGRLVKMFGDKVAYKKAE